MNKAVIFGAGNIGRSFIGNIFASNGWEVTFIDANRELVDLLNSRGGYPILIKKNGQPDKTLEVRGISAVHSSEYEMIMEKLCSCNICATSVGQGALKFVIPQLVEAVKKRQADGAATLDIIIAENIRNGADYFRRVFREHGLTGEEAGLVETSIGKMVPIMTTDDLASDPLLLHAEEYNSLILDEDGFTGKIPDFPEIKAVRNVAAWVDRKLFIHNLGHAAAAYFGYEAYPERRLIAEVIKDEAIKTRIRAAMSEAAAALLAEYPKDFTREALDEHIDDLLYRFGNSALGDTVFRVGRDLYRKLGRDDRILGAAALCIKHQLPNSRILEVFRAALGFKAEDIAGNMFIDDIEFHSRLGIIGEEIMLTTRLGLTKSDRELETQIMKTLGENTGS
ncbi:MAG: mannitol-1-phosphate 5-dehydrogenase [Spirochaetales bacterium]|nr:mannitol-1-phosphate 5-dehydrogenase [Spirochaetales bacterium]